MDETLSMLQVLKKKLRINFPNFITTLSQFCQKHYVLTRLQLMHDNNLD
jgi:hypothetical protein